MYVCFFTEKVNGKIVKAKLRHGDKITTVYLNEVRGEWIASEKQIIAINKFIGTNK